MRADLRGANSKTIKESGKAVNHAITVTLLV